MGRRRRNQTDYAGLSRVSKLQPRPAARRRKRTRSQIERQIQRLLKNPRIQIPHRSTLPSHLPTYGKNPDFFRELLKHCLRASHSNPSTGLKDTSVAIRLTPYLEDRCLIVQAWLLLGFNLRIQGFLRKSESAIQVACRFYSDGECSACEAVVLRHRAHLLHCRAYKARDKHFWKEAVVLAECSVSIARSITETGHDIESGGVAASLVCLADINFHSGCVLSAIERGSEALALIKAKKSPELYDVAVFNVAYYLKSFGGQENLLIVEAAIKTMRKRFKGRTGPDYFQAKLDWFEAQVRWELGRRPSSRVWMLMERARGCFKSSRMRTEYVAITTDLSRMRLAERHVVAALIHDLIVRADGLPASIRMALLGVRRAVTKGTWEAEEELREALKALRAAAEGGGVLPAVITY